MSDRNHSVNIVVCVPVFNDWTACLELIRNLKNVLSADVHACVLLVDDGSTEKPDLDALKKLQADSLIRIEIVHLVTNIGHQRAIAVGLSVIDADYSCDFVVVMDGDGEDNPEHLPRLLGEAEAGDACTIVLARRNRRSESLLFRLGYRCFKVLHRILTGISCDVGNFSVIPTKCLRQITYAPDLWNHYAATVISSRTPVKKVDCPRGQRYAGRSKMNITSLIAHGLRAISVFGETVGVRVSMALGMLGFLSFAGLVSVILIRLFTDLAIPGWASYTAGILLILCINFLILTAMSLFFLLKARSSTEFIPARDWSVFVANREKFDE